MSRTALAFVALVTVVTTVHARTIVLSPANPGAMEFIEARIDLNSCERVIGVEPTNGGFRIRVDSELPGPRCDALGVTELTLGAFPPGTYRISTAIVFPGSPPTATEDGSATITVSPGPGSTFPGNDTPRVDLSGLWTTPSEPFAGFAFIHSADGVTGIWYDYRANGQPGWTLLLPAGVVDPVATGQGPTRTIAQPSIGTAALAIDMSGNIRLRGSVGARTFDFPLERFRWTRAAWPARAPAPQ